MHSRGSGKQTHPAKVDIAQRYLTAVVESTDDAVIGATPKGKILSWNRSAEKLFGYKIREVKGKPISIMLPPERAAELTPIFKQVRSGKGVEHLETTCIDKQGQRIPFSLTITPVTDDAGKVISSVIVARDITRRVQGRETILKRSRELLTFHKLSEIVLSPLTLAECYRHIADEICAATGFPITTIAIYDEARQIMTFQGLRGYPLKPDRTVLELPVDQTISSTIVRTGKPLIETHLRDHPAYKSILMRSMQAETFVGYPMKFNGKIIGSLNLAHTESVEINENTARWIESLANYVAVLTERKRGEEELRASREQLRELSIHTQSVIEEERKRIAREIHDQLGQELSLFQLELGVIQDKIPRTEKDLRRKLKSMSKLVDISIQTVQRISADLRPMLLDNLGLGAAVEWAAKEFQKRTSIRCQISVDPPEIKLDQERSTALFRILQEALTNILRHSKANKVNVRLTKKENAIVLSVRDNGIGIPAHRITDAKSVGLTGMRERVYPWSGNVSITVEPSKGTEVTVTVPLKP